MNIENILIKFNNKEYKTRLIIKNKEKKYFVYLPYSATWFNTDTFSEPTKNTLEKLINENIM